MVNMMLLDDMHSKTKTNSCSYSLSRIYIGPEQAKFKSNFCENRELYTNDHIKLFEGIGNIIITENDEKKTKINNIFFCIWQIEKVNNSKESPSGSLKFKIARS